MTCPGWWWKRRLRRACSYPAHALILVLGSPLGVQPEFSEALQRSYQCVFRLHTSVFNSVNGGSATHQPYRHDPWKAAALSLPHHYHFTAFTVLSLQSRETKCLQSYFHFSKKQVCCTSCVWHGEHQSFRAKLQLKRSQSQCQVNEMFNSSRTSVTFAVVLKVTHVSLSFLFPKAQQRVVQRQLNALSHYIAPPEGALITLVLF